MTKRLDLALVWHMHQPDYRDPETGEFLFPWVYLHAIKDYADMAWHLEHRPQVRATVNLVPVLLDQVEAYADAFGSGSVPDPLLRLLVHPDLDRIGAAERRLILDSCFRSNHTRMIEPFPAYRFLLDLFKRTDEKSDAGRAYLSGQYLADLLTWYHLAWTGESVRREHALVVDLMTKGAGYTHADRRRLFDLIGELLQGIVPRYRALAAAGRIELTTTPQQHPLAPLIVDLASAREMLPDAPMPSEAVYPGGRTRISTHLAAAMQSHARRFGAAPEGVWPAEGAVSSPVLRLFAEGGCRWAASSEAVLVNSLTAAGRKPGKKGEFLYRPYEASGLTMLFRDDHLSDLIGFEYAKWHGKDAATHFIAQLEAIATAAPAGEVPLVSVILDGENAWEYYPYNGYYFLQDLYSALEGHASIATVTPARWLAEHPGAARASLDRIAAGSWVYGNLSTWVGSPDKNRAWDLLCAAKRSFDLVAASGRLTPEDLAIAERRLAVCEASDWFWWFGDYNPEHAVASFDRLYRRNLECLYRSLRLEPPGALAERIGRGRGDPEAGGAMRRAT
jgi:alpha-amylase/alpha-mannosidase (GH57 family)